MRSLVLASLLCLPSLAHAQVIFRAPIVGHSRAEVSATAHRTVAAAVPGGGTLAALHFDADLLLGHQRIRSLDAGRTVALARLDPRGRVVWVRRFAEEARGGAHLRTIERILPLADGGAILGGSFGDGGLDQGALVRIGPDGRTVWELHPSRTSDYSRFSPALTSRGTVALLGSFFRGRFQLPGAPAWSGRQRFTSFLAEVAVSDGSVRWARQVPGHGAQISVGPSGELLVSGTFRRVLRHGGQTLRGTDRDDVFVARFDADGEPRDAAVVGNPGDDAARGLAVLGDGSFAVLSSNGPGALERYGLTGFDAEGQRRFSRPLGRSATLVRGARSGYLALVAGASHTARIRSTPYDVVDRFDLIGLDAFGVPTGRRPIALEGVEVLTRSVRAAAVGEQIVLSGALTASRGGGSESFHVWIDAPPRRAAVARPAHGAIL